MATCAGVRYEGNWPHNCHRDAVEGERFCKLHLAGRKRRAANDAKREQQWNERAARISQVMNLAAAAGIRGADVSVDNDDVVVMPFTSFLDIATRLSK